MRKTIIVPFLFLCFHVFCQEKIPFVDINEVALKVAKATQNGNYEEAIELLDVVSENDSTYTSILVSKAYYQLALQQFDEAIITIDEGLQTDCGDLKASFYQNKGAALIGQEKFEEAIEVLDEALKLFPKNHLLNFNKALSLERLGRIEEAVKEYETTITLDPFYKKSYQQLGNICYRQERISQALMCFNMYLLLEPDADGAFKTLSAINNIVKGKNENKRDATVQISEDDESFEEIDLILTNRIALNKSYKIDNPINIAIVRQNHIMFEQLKSFKGNGGFWDTKFVPFYKWIQAEGHFDDFVFTTMYSIENEKFKKVVEKNEKKIITFINLYQPKWTEIVQKNTIDWNGKKEEVTFYYDGYLQAIGKMENDVTKGYWEFYNEKGRITGIGNFDAKGNRDGKWTWFNQFGKKKEEAFYKMGKLDGDYQGFYDNGEVAVVNSYKNDALEGEYKKYSNKGALLEKKYFKSGKLQGLYKSYFEVGEDALEYHIPYKNDQVDQKAIEYYSNGEVFSEMLFQNGERNGITRKFHANKEKFAEISYSNGELNGPYKKYYKNGNLSEEGQSVGNYFDGPWKTYYSNGKLQSDFTYDKGYQNGPYIYYDTDGKLYYEYIYKKGEIIAYKFYDKTGNVLKEAKKKGGEFMYESYAPNGNKTSEGLYDISGGKMGEWKFYTVNGTLNDKGQYNNNLTQGEYVRYFKNGKPLSVSNYKNDSLVGYYVDYHKNGNLASQGWYKNGERHGEWRTYYQDKTLSIINFYHRGKFHGKQEYYSGDGKLHRVAKYKYDELLSDDYYDQEGVIFETITYHDKKGSHTALTHYLNKNVETSVDYLNGVKHGSYVYHDFYGNKRTTATYVSGKINGMLTRYHKDGSVESTMNYLNGDRHGDYTAYYENGTIESKGFYNLGTIENVWTNYYEDGTVDTISEYENDEYHGRKEFYSPTGKLQLVRFYDHGRLIGYSYLDKNAKELPMIPIENETANIKAYYDNGNVSRALEYKNGDVINEYKTYYYNGQLENEMTYEQDLLNGLDIEYYPDGTKKSEEPYLLGDLHGTLKKFYPNGKLKEETNYANDDRVGTSRTYDSTGKLIRSEIYFNDDIISSKAN